MPWAVYVAILWLVAAAFAFLNLVPYATDTARHVLVPYSVVLVVSILAYLKGSFRS